MAPSARVFTLDTDQQALEARARVLQGAGYIVVPCGAAGDAVTAVAECNPALVIIRQQLQGPSRGLDVCRRLYESGLRAPVILLADAPDEPLVLEAMRAGVRDVVASDAGESALLESVGRVLGAAQAAAAAGEARRQGDRFRELADAMPQLVWTARPDGTVDYYNQRHREFEGIQPQDGGGWTWAPVVHPDDVERTRQTWERSIATGVPYEIEHRVRRSGGEYRWMVSRAVPARDPDGVIQAWYGTATDVHALKQAQERSQESEERLQLAAAAARMFAFGWHVESDEVRRSAECASILGVGEIDTGQQFFARVHPDDRAPFVDTLRRLTPASPTYATSYRVNRPDGSVAYLEEHGRGTFGANGQLLHLIGMTADVTSRRIAERQLSETTTILRAVAETTPDAIYVKNRDGHLVFANPATRRILGLAGQEALARVEEQLPPGPHTDAIRANDRRVIESGVTAWFEEVLDTPDGARVFLSAKSPLRDESGAIVGLVGISSDITGRQRAEQQLRESEQRLVLATDAAGLGVFGWRAVDDAASWHNDRMYELVGQDRADGVMGRDEFMSLVHPAELPQFGSDGLRSRIVAGEPLHLVFRLRRKRDDAWRWLEMFGQLSLGPAGEAESMAGVLGDITDRVEAEQERQRLLQREQAARAQAEHASRLKDEFLATLSHELRTPLNAILGWAQLLIARPVEDQERVRQILATISRNAQAQARLVEDLLDMNRMVSGQMRLDRQAVHLPATVHAAVEAVAPAADAKSIAVRVAVAGPRGDLTVIGDAARLQQVIWNLLINAVKFTPAGGTIEVTLESAGNDVRVRVRDTGEGIDPDFLPFVFDRFRQGDGSTTRTHGGLGLGLSIARHLVELHGGTIEVESEGRGCGACFTVSLRSAPMFDVDLDGEPPAGEPWHGATGGTALRGVRVLVVEDDDDTRELVVKVLEDRGASVIGAGAVDPALEELSRAQFDVLLVDIAMPGRDGFDLLKEVRGLGDARVRALPVIALTAFARGEDRDRALAAGFTAYAAKPIAPSDLVSLVAATAAASQR